jgi:hypothetical protein
MRGIEPPDRNSGKPPKVYNVVKTIISHPPVITIFMGGIDHQKWGVYSCFNHNNMYVTD